jgi:hypothetical protein
MKNNNDDDDDDDDDNNRFQYYDYWDLLQILQNKIFQRSSQTPSLDWYFKIFLEPCQSSSCQNVLSDFFYIDPWIQYYYLWYLLFSHNFFISEQK